MFASSATGAGTGVSPSPSPPPATLSRTLTRAARFVHAYYKTLATDPAELYTYYEDDSTMVRIDDTSNGTDITNAFVDHAPLVGQYDIHQFVTQQNYQNSKIKVESVDAQESNDESLLVLVRGLIVSQSQQPQSFVQNFYLVRDHDEETTRFYVRNDIQRIVSQWPSVSAHAAQTASQGTNTAVTSESRDTQTQPASPVKAKSRATSPLPPATADETPKSPTLTAPAPLSAKASPRRQASLPIDTHADALAPPRSPEREAIAAVAPASTPEHAPAVPVEAAGVVKVTEPTETENASVAASQSVISPPAAANGTANKRDNRRQGRGKSATGKHVQSAGATATQGAASVVEPTKPAAPMSWASRVQIAAPKPTPSATSPPPAAVQQQPASSPMVSAARTAASPSRAAAASASPSIAPAPTNASTESTDTANDGEGEFKPVSKQRPLRNRDQQQGARGGVSDYGGRGGRGGRGGFDGSTRGDRGGQPKQKPAAAKGQ